MHRVFTAWAKAAGEREWSPKGLAAALKDREFRSKQSNCMFWLDCRLTRSELDFSEPAPSRQEGGEDDA
jgi:putative DNA primase/helicase